MTIFFLPGAGASATFWKNVSNRLLLDDADRSFFAWPGLGNQPPDPAVRRIDDLVRMVVEALEARTQPVDMVAQSMGGYVAMQAALLVPHKIRRLVLTATSAGVPMGELGATNWREDYQASFPHAAEWIAQPTEDLSARLQGVTAPCLLLWGDADPISPVAVGERLLGLLPAARLHILAGGDHDLAITHAPEVAGLVAAHLK
jgi:pimeloyl-ACP methyl ester carboxylesterase